MMTSEHGRGGWWVPGDPDARVPLGRPSVRYYPYVRVIAPAVDPSTGDDIEYVDELLIGIYADDYAAERAFNDWCRDNPTTLVHQFVKESRIVAPLPLPDPSDPTPPEGEPW